MKYLLLALTLTQAPLAWGHIAHHYQTDAFPPVPISITVGGASARFAYAGTVCVLTDTNATDGGTLDAFTISAAASGGNNTDSLGRAVCRLALKFLSGSCSIGASNTYVCPGEVAPTAPCVINNNTQATCG